MERMKHCLRAPVEGLQFRRDHTSTGALQIPKLLSWIENGDAIRFE